MELQNTEAGLRRQIPRRHHDGDGRELQVGPQTRSAEVGKGQPADHGRNSESGAGNDESIGREDAWTEKVEERKCDGTSFGLGTHPLSNFWQA